MTIAGLCRTAGLSRQAYYTGRRDRARQACATAEVVAAVQQERRDQPRIGTRKLVGLLRKAGVTIGRDRLFAVLRRHEMLVRPKKKTFRTTYYDETLPVFRNLLYEFEPTAPNQVWVCDLTYIATDEGPLLLALITDLVSRRIVGWHVAESMTGIEASNALKMALAQLPPHCRPIHHSDRGSQYCCHDYVGFAQKRGVQISMTEQNHCYENCYAERVNGILKDEYHLDAVFRTRHQARRAIEQAIATYNGRRPHTSLAMLTPNEAHQLVA